MRKRQKTTKLRLTKETLLTINEMKSGIVGASNNRVCATYTEVIGPCVQTYYCQHPTYSQYFC